MMLDHSLMYRQFRLWNLPHRMRLNAIEREIKRLNIKSDTYADFGCSNGYITERVSKIVDSKETWGFDWKEGHLSSARELHPGINFTLLDLNETNSFLTKFDFVTCFETLEHVGTPNTALENLLTSLQPNSTILISVPIEIGLLGLLKFIIKLAFGYNLKELQKPSILTYLLALAKGERISKFRDKRRKGWGTHFGFDYRDLDDSLVNSGIAWDAWNSGTTRFYRVKS